MTEISPPTPLARTAFPLPPRPFPLLAVVIFAALFLVALWPALGSGHLWHHDEILTAERSREVLVYGDLDVVRLNGKPNFHKPPFQYWLTAISLRLMPADQPERAVRLPSALFAALCLVGTALLGRAAWPDDPLAGPAAAVALAGCGFWVHFVRMGMLDAGAALGVVGTLLGAEIARGRGRNGGDPRGWWLAAGAATMGAWQKAPYALGAWVFALISRTRTGELSPAPTRWPRALRAALLAAGLLAFAWPAWQLARFGSAEVFKGQADSTGNLFNLNKSAGFQPWLYPWWLVRDWAAVGLLVPAAIGAAFWRSRGRGGTADPFRREAAAMLLIGWGVVMCLPYRTERYLIFLAPLAALLVVRFLRVDTAGQPRRWGGAFLAVALASTVPVATFHYAKKTRREPQLHAAARAFGTACAADPAATPVVDRAAGAGVNVLSFVLFYGDLQRPTVFFWDWTARSVTRADHRAAGERFVGLSRASHAAVFAPTRELSRHGDWVVWEKAALRAE